MGIDVEIKMGDLFKDLKKIPEKVQKRVLTGAVRAGAKPIVKEARRLVPVKTGNLKKSIGVTKRRSKDKNIVVFSVSPRKGGKYDGFYGMYVELGHILKRNKKVIGHVPAHPFLRPAFENKGEESIKAFKEYMKKRLEKELKK